MIERISLEDGRIVVACISVPGNPGTSVTNTVESICDQVCLQLRSSQRTSYGLRI